MGGLRCSFPIVLLLLVCAGNRAAGTENYGTDDETNETDQNEEVADNVGVRSWEPVTAKEPVPMSKPTSLVPGGTKPLDCFICAYKAHASKECLDPVKYKVRTVTCAKAEERCYTSVTRSNSSLLSVFRGCRHNCTNVANVTCCETNRCNNKPFASTPMTMRVVKILETRNKSNKTMQPTVLFFVTVLLVLQTVVKVAIV